MMTIFMLVISIVIPHQCMNPATSTHVSKTHIITNTEPLQLPKVIKVVKKMQTMAMLTF